MLDAADHGGYDHYERICVVRVLCTYIRRFCASRRVVYSFALPHHNPDIHFFVRQVVCISKDFVVIKYI